MHAHLCHGLLALLHLSVRPGYYSPCSIGGVRGPEECLPTHIQTASTVKIHENSKSPIPANTVHYCCCRAAFIRKRGRDTGAVAATPWMAAGAVPVPASCVGHHVHVRPFPQPRSQVGPSSHGRLQLALLQLQRHWPEDIGCCGCADMYTVAHVVGAEK